MSRQLLMGNQAMGMAAIAAGVSVVSGYPGTPSTEVLETIAKHNPGDIHVEWSTNEKAAMEVAAGASMCGARSLVTMKQMGLNVASDPLMTLAYLGVEGGMVILVADDPGPISSQTEQDTRTFARFARVPVLDPSSPEEAYEMIRDAFEISERFSTPVIVRPTTRVCHACAPIEVSQRETHEASGFSKDPRWVVFPSLSTRNHLRIDAQLPLIAQASFDYRLNAIYDVEDAEGTDEDYRADSIVSSRSHRGIVTGGVSNAYAMEALNMLSVSYRLFHVATPYPFPDDLALDFLEGLDEVLVYEELDPYLESELLRLVGRYHLDVTVKGKLSGDASGAGENSVEDARHRFSDFFGLKYTPQPDVEMPELPIRPPVLCAGCPHRGSFYAVKKALGKRKAVFSGDIGCYTLGNAQPLDMVDTCLCMGAGITQAQGIHCVQPDTKNIAFVGDSTFFASGITGMVNAVYNQHDITLIVLDNSTTAMTGQQPHPGTGVTMMGERVEPVSIARTLEGIGVRCVLHADPLDFEASKNAVSQAVDFEGPSAVIFESPCIQLIKPSPAVTIDTETCTNCQTCIRQLGCPGLILDEGGRVAIDASLCNGCGLCVQICPFDAIVKEAL